MNNVTRFAPSPTGSFHIGSARTALFNKLYSKSKGGKFLLRIEDTDKARSTDEAIKSITNDMKWLGLDWDGDIVFQSLNAKKHQEIAEKLLDEGIAYRCYLTPDDIENIKKQNPHEKILSPWRDANKAPSKGGDFAVRLKVNEKGKTSINDAVQGEVSVNHNQLDDLILLRSDRSPTYMLAVVVDDYDMRVTNIIRGDDHLTNTFRQIQIYNALGWNIPKYAHIPLIHGNDGGKLSKRHGALGIDEYRKKGYLPEAICNYLLRLGWGYGDNEIMDMEFAAKVFSLDDIGKSPSRLDFDKMNFINAHYLNNHDNEKILKHTLEALGIKEDEIISNRLKVAMDDIKSRSKTLNDVAEMAKLYIKKQEIPDDKSLKILSDYNQELLNGITAVIKNIEDWNIESIKESCDNFAQDNEIKIGLVMKYLRAFIVGNFNSPGIWNVMNALGKREVLERIFNKPNI